MKDRIAECHSKNCVPTKLKKRSLQNTRLQNVIPKTGFQPDTNKKIMKHKIARLPARHKQEDYAT
jgi:hypothetical protein